MCLYHNLGSPQWKKKTNYSYNIHDLLKRCKYWEHFYLYYPLGTGEKKLYHITSIKVTFELIAQFMYSRWVVMAFYFSLPVIPTNIKNNIFIYRLIYRQNNMISTII